MTSRIELKASAATADTLREMAAGAGLEAGKLAGVLLDSFIENGGKIYVGAWKEGPGIRIVPDWPRFSSGIVKLTEAEMQGASDE